MHEVSDRSAARWTDYIEVLTRTGET